MRNTNPVFSRIYKERATQQETTQGQVLDTATYLGVGLKVLMYVLLTIAGAIGAVAMIVNRVETLMPVLIASSIGSLIFSMIALFFPTASSWAGTIYCIMQGFLLGTVTYIVNKELPGIAVTAILTTVSVVLVVAILFSTKLVKVTNRFVNFVMILTFSVIFAFFLSMILSLFSSSISEFFTSQNTWIGLGISVVVALLATFYIFLDLENIKSIVEGQCDKRYEWYAAFGFVFTILWLYVRILYILIIIRRYTSRN